MLAIQFIHIDTYSRDRSRPLTPDFLATFKAICDWHANKFLLLFEFLPDWKTLIGSFLANFELVKWIEHIAFWKLHKVKLVWCKWFNTRNNLLTQKLPWLDWNWKVSLTQLVLKLISKASSLKKCFGKQVVNVRFLKNPDLRSGLHILLFCFGRLLIKCIISLLTFIRVQFASKVMPRAYKFSFKLWKWKKAEVTSNFSERF